MGVGARLGGTYKDAIGLFCFGHNYGYYRDLAGLSKSKRVNFVRYFSVLQDGRLV
jgi:hypothetical protein